MEGEQHNVNVGGGDGGSAGPIIGVIVILAIIILGGLYFWGQRVGNSTTDSIDRQSSSDEISSIEADLNTTDIDSIDADLSAS